MQIPSGFKEIPKFPGYFINTEGIVYGPRRKFKHPKLPTFITGGYKAMSLRKDKKGYMVKVSTLILETFVGPRPSGHCACHGIKGKTCDSLDNLYWATQKQNCTDKLRDGTGNKGERHNLHKLTEAQVLEIRRLHATGDISMYRLAKDYGVTDVAIGYIVKRIHWKHI